MKHCPQLNDADFESARRGILNAARRYNVRLAQEDIEDLEQESLLRFLKHVDPAKVRCRAAFLTRLGHNCFVDAMRRRSAARRDVRQTVPLNGFDAVTRVGPEIECVARAELRAALGDCRDLLSDQHFKILVLTYVHGLRGAEVAQVFNLSPTNVYSILSRTRQKLAAAGIAISPRAACRC